MTNDVSPAGKSGNEEKSNDTEQVTELSEDMEMVSPGAMLREARKALSFSQEHIASKLNFKVTLVQNIEEDIFDPSMPVTFNRGYLANYAKLVGVDIEDVLASYDALDAASIQRSEMLSFSKETFKQAEHSRVMWLSYLIVAVLVGLTILWWQQESNQQSSSTENISLNSSRSNSSEVTANNDDTTQQTVVTGENRLELSEKALLLNNTGSGESNADLSETSGLTSGEIGTSDIAKSASINAEPNKKVTETATLKEAVISTAVFTFSGDCWVNIYDATGERIAWGVKKSGYVMTIQGQAPLRITVGKPELTSIVYNGQTVDMSSFNVGNIAKFNLPIIVD